MLVIGSWQDGCVGFTHEILSNQLHCREACGWRKKEKKDKEKTDNRCPTCGQRLHRLRTQRRRSLSRTQTPSTVCSLEDTKPPFCPLSGQLHGSYRSPGMTLITNINKKNMVLMFDRKVIFASIFRLWNKSFLLLKLL